jgi:hypothetical protein
LILRGYFIYDVETQAKEISLAGRISEKKSSAE